MFAKTLVALAAIAGANAAPIASSSAAAAAPAPTGYALGYLEDYQVYHARYLALECKDHRNATWKDDFFEDCCHPALAKENITLSRPDYCIPSNATLTSAAAVVATATEVASTVESVFCDEATSVAAYVNSVVATATESLTQVTYTAGNYSATVAVLTETATATATPVTWSSAEAPAATQEVVSSSSAVVNEWVAPTSTSTSEWVAPTTSSTPVYVAPTTSETPVYVAPTTSEAPAPAQTQAAPAGNGNEWHGDAYATYFYQNGNPGACGNYNSDSALIVAIGSSYYGNYGSTSGNCGKWINIKRTDTGATVSAQIADVCPTCITGNSIDLSVGAFTAIASEGEGLVPVTWQFA